MWKSSSCIKRSSSSSVHASESPGADPESSWGWKDADGTQVSSKLVGDPRECEEDATDDVNPEEDDTDDVKLESIDQLELSRGSESEC